MAAPLTLMRESFLRGLRGSKLIRDKLIALGQNPEFPDAIRYRMARETVAVPGITFFDFGNRPDVVVPLHSRTLQIDIWTEKLEDAEELAGYVDLVIQALGSFCEALYVANISLTSDRDNIVPEGFMSRKTLLYNMLAYERASTGLVGSASLTVTAVEPSLS